MPITSKNGLASAKADSSPPTMIDSVAFLAPESPPDTGASMAVLPAAAAAAEIRAASDGSLVVRSTNRAPRFADATMPSAPR